MNITNKTAPILLIGGNGKTGRRVAERLADRGERFRAVSRSTEIPFDWNDETTWKATLEGARAVYITYQPDLAVPGAIDHVTGFANLALSMGIRRMVLLSGRGEPEAEAAEEAFKATGADWTIVRAGWFAQNFSESFFRDAVMTGELALPAEGVREAFVDADDIADVVTAALTDDRHIGELYEVTGPRLLDFDEVAAIISAETGRPLRFKPVSLDAYAETLASFGLDEDFISLIRYLFTAALDGRNAYLCDGVERALGRPARDFTDYVRAAAAAGAWKDAA